jgi:hypothetical protein
VIKQKDLVRQLEAIINRLEDVVFDKTVDYDVEEAELQGENIALNEEVAEGIEGPEAAFLVLERRMDELVETVEEETENLRRLLERIEEGD